MARQERRCRRRDAEEVGDQVFDRWQAGIAILNCLYGVQLVFSEDMAAAFCRALNDYIAKEWLDRDPRLRASIVIPMQNVEYAVDEIERCAKDKRFVQVLVLAMQEVPLGRRHFWPIYAACDAPRPADRHPRRLRLPQSGDRRSAGRPGTSRTMPPRRRAFSRRSQA